MLVEGRQMLSELEKALAGLEVAGTRVNTTVFNTF